VPDLLLLDLMMPGLDGCEVTAQLKGNAATSHIPVVIISAMSDRATRVQRRSTGLHRQAGRPHGALSARERHHGTPTRLTDGLMKTPKIEH
jgi:CheY-like chemotaxis protein